MLLNSTSRQPQSIQSTRKDTILSYKFSIIQEKLRRIKKVWTRAVKKHRLKKIVQVRKEDVFRRLNKKRKKRVMKRRKEKRRQLRRKRR